MPRQYNMGDSANKGFGGKKVSTPAAPKKEWKELCDDDPMPIGKYGPKGKDPRTMEKIPASYLLWMWDSFMHAKRNDPVHHYIKKSWTALLQECPDAIIKNPPKDLQTPASNQPRKAQQEMDWNEQIETNPTKIEEADSYDQRTAEDYE